VLRVTITIGLVLAAIWMFLEGREFSGPAHELPTWLVGVPPWVLGFIFLVVALIAAVVPTETVEELVERLLSPRSRGDGDDGDYRKHGGE
jgi:hypothetical protein